MDDEMKREFAAIRSDIVKMAAATRDDIAKLAAASRADIAKLTTVCQHMFSKISHLEDKTDRIAKRMVDRDEFNNRFDDVAKRIDEIDFRLAVHFDQLQGHEKRIGRLEQRRA